MTGPARLSNDAIRDYAERVGKSHSIYDSYGCADIDGLLHKLGGRVVYQDGSEALWVGGKGSFTVFLPKMTSSRRDRFTIAHEIGHYFLHYLLPDSRQPESFGRGQRNLEETQANVFASSLLMPSEAFTRAHRECQGDSWRLAERFEVSPAAADVRSQVLGLA